MLHIYNTLSYSVCLGLQKHTLALEAVERCITLFMALGNLHWFTAATCPPELKVGLLQRQIQRL